MRQQAGAERSRIDAGQCSQLETAVAEQIEVKLAWTRFEYCRVAAIHVFGRCRLQKNDAPAAGHPGAQRLESGTQGTGIHNVLQNCNAQHQVELPGDIESGYITDVEAAASGDTFTLRTAARFPDHGWADVDSCYVSSSRRQQPAPATNTTTENQDTGTNRHQQPRRECEPLFQVDCTVIKLGHAVRTHGSQSCALARKAARPILPVQVRDI